MGVVGTCVCNELNQWELGSSVKRKVGQSGRVAMCAGKCVCGKKGVAGVCVY